MNKNQMKVFMVVSVEGSILKAADFLYMSATGVFKQLNSLENELGVRLFTRTSKGCILTKEGKVFEQFVKEYNKSYNKMMDKLADINKTITIGYDETIGQQYVSKIFSKLENVNCSFKESKYEQFEKRILDGEIDFCFYLKPIRLSKLMEYEEICEKNAYVFCRNESEIAQKKEINYYELAQYRIFTAKLNNSNSMRKLIDKSEETKFDFVPLEDFFEKGDIGAVYLTSGLLDVNKPGYSLVKLKDIIVSYGVLYLKENKDKVKPLINKTVECFNTKDN